MAYDEGLAERLRDFFDGEAGVSEKKMFGGLAFMVDDKMSVGVIKDDLMVRVGSERNDLALAQPHARPMDFTGRPMKGFVYVSPRGIESDERLKWWVEQGIAFARAASEPSEKRSRPNLKPAKSVRRGKK